MECPSSLRYQDIFTIARVFRRVPKFSKGISFSRPRFLSSVPHVRLSQLLATMGKHSKHGHKSGQGEGGSGKSKQENPKKSETEVLPYWYCVNTVPALG